MAPALDGDLGVDVLIIGGGIQGMYLARALHKDYSICVVTDPAAPSETLDSPGFMSAGYTGNDVARIQPARRAAGYWGLWAESNGIAHGYAPSYYVMRNDEEVMRTRLWSDATLSAKPALALPQIFDRGSLDSQSAWITEHDLVINPGDVVAKLREGFEDRVIAGEVVKFGIITDEAIDFIEVQLADGQIVPITPRYVILASNVGNGGLLQRLVTMFKDRQKRKEAVDTMRSCQAVRRRITIVARGDLPLLSGHFDGYDITAHPFRPGGAPGAPGENVWIINPPIDDSQTVRGPEEVRFQPKLEPDAVRSALHNVFAMSPELERRAGELRWGAYNARKTEHPMMAVPDTSAVAQPAPARLETLGMDSFVAVWPSHLSYAMIVGDVVAERVAQALGPAGDHTGGLQVSDFPQLATEQRLARWERASFAWSDWSTFKAQFGY
jgi:glycine/D-amino acid oxidase-like deaminating enzyme